MTDILFFLSSTGDWVATVASPVSIAGCVLAHEKLWQQNYNSGSLETPLLWRI